MNPDSQHVWTDCPSIVELQAFNCGAISEEKELVIATHIAACPRCEADLEALPRGVSPLLHAHHEDVDPLEELRAEEGLEKLRLMAHVMAEDLAVSHDTPRPNNLNSTASEQLDADTKIRAERARAARRREEPIPERIGKYPVIARISQGGFGVVYKANDPAHNRLVAIKAPRPDRLAAPVGEEAIEQFFAEAKTAASLKHPGIVQVFDWGLTEDKRPFVVMEFIDGQSLEELLCSERISWRRAVRLMLQVAEALEYTHAREIYHRDIKPANILIDSKGEARLSDFGLAVRESERWAQIGKRAGTGHYMAPEQFASNHNLDARCDVWAVGVILYRMLTGKLPFTGRTYEELSADISERPLPMPTGNVPKRLLDICKRCLQKGVAERYATIREFADELRGARLKRRVLIGAAGFGLVSLAAGGYHLATRSSKIRFPEGEPHLVAWRPTNVVPVFVPATGRLQVPKTAEISLLSCGDHQGASFQVELDVGVSHWMGTAAIFWGLHHTNQPEGHQVCFALCVRRADARDPMLIKLEKWRVREHRRDVHRVEPERELASGKGAVPSAKITSLRITVRDSMLRELVWGDNPVQMNEYSGPMKWPHDELSRFGVSTLGADVIFQRGVFTPLGDTE